MEVPLPIAAIGELMDEAANEPELKGKITQIYCTVPHHSPFLGGPCSLY